MSDDLPAELRSNAAVLERVADRGYSADLERRAADEIERLRIKCQSLEEDLSQARTEAAITEHFLRNHIEPY